MGGLSGPDDMSAAATGGWNPDDTAAGASGGPSGAGTDFASLPGGANTGGNVGAQPGQPLVGGGESFGSPATTGGANPDTAAQAQTPGGADVSPSPDAASGDHSTMGTSGNT